jgi:hypothetical protein
VASVRTDLARRRPIFADAEPPGNTYSAATRRIAVPLGNPSLFSPRPRKNRFAPRN